MDKGKIYDFIIKGSGLITALAIFLALFVSAVKYANKDFENRVEQELDTIKNNHIFHVNKDIQELKEDNKAIRVEMKNEFNKTNERLDKTDEKINKIENDVSKISAQQEIIIKLLTDKKKIK